MSGQHITEFRSFLERFPSVFKLKEELVLLKEFENELPVLSKEEPVMDLIDRDKVLKLIEFYGNCLEERGPMLVEQLFHASGVNDLNWLFKCPKDLRAFFHIHSRCFQVMFLNKDLTHIQTDRVI